MSVEITSTWYLNKAFLYCTHIQLHQMFTRPVDLLSVVKSYIIILPYLKQSGSFVGEGKGPVVSLKEAAITILANALVLGSVLILAVVSGVNFDDDSTWSLSIIITSCCIFF